MTWAKFDDGFPQHPKVALLNDAAFRLHVTAICYSAKHLTDGMISGAIACTLVGSRARKLALVLVGAGLWEHIEDDVFRIHDYLEFNPSKEQVERIRDSKSIAGAMGAAKRWDGSRHESANSPTRPVPSRPVEQQRAAVEPRASATSMPPLRLEDATRAYQAWDKQSPMGMNPAIKEKLDAELESGTPVEFIEKACQIAGEAGGRKPWNYVNSILSRLKAGKPDKKPAENTMQIFRVKKASNS